MMSKTLIWLNSSFEEHSIIWLLISSILGGIVGAFIKLSFENILPFRIQKKRKLLATKRQYSTPILWASEALRNRLDNIIRLIEKIEKGDWLCREDYYYTSTVYIVSRFWGWIELLRRSVIYLDWPSVKETRNFESYIEAIEDGFSKPSLLHEPTGETDWCYSYELYAIGEIMIIKSDIEGEYRLLGYSEFSNKFNNDKDFKKYVQKLNRIFYQLNSDQTKFKRVIAIHAILNDFINYLDPKHVYVEKEDNYLIKLTNGEELKKIKEILESLKKNK